MNRARIFRLFRSPRINSKEPIQSLAGRYDNPVPYSVPSPHRLFKNLAQIKPPGTEVLFISSFEQRGPGDNRVELSR